MEERLVIWQLDNLLNLDVIKNLLKKDYNKDIDFINKLIEQGEITVDREVDRVYQNDWYTEVGDDNFEIKNVNLGEYSINYISAIGSFEYGFGEKRAFIDGYLLSRNKRVFKKECNAVFFEFEDRVYIALQTLEGNERIIKSNLLGQGRTNRREEWGQIDRVAPPFTFDSSFFYWLLTKKGQDVEFKGKNTQVIDVNAISVLSEKSSYDNTSQGNALLEFCLPALSVLSVNEAITKIGVKLKINEYEIVLKFNKNAEVFVDPYKTFKLAADDGNNTYYDDDSNQFILMIFGYIFPAFLEVYDTQKQNVSWQESMKEWQKVWAINVVKTLMEHNSITLAELNTEAQEANTKTV